MSNKKEILQDYLKTKVKPVFDKLIARLLIDKPDNVYTYSIDWLSEQQGLDTQTRLMDTNTNFKIELIEYQLSEEEQEENELDEETELEIMKKAQQKKTQMRTSVSAEAYGQFNKQKDFQPRVIQKSQDQKDRVKHRMLNSFMFQALDEKEMEVVLDAMEEKIFKPEDWVITQGDDGDELYVIDSGQLECYKKFKPDDEPKFLRNYEAGESFGELALLYNAPRAASIKAVTEAVTFALDRDTFNNIVKFAAMKKREQLEKIFSKIELLQCMDAYERLQLIDALQQVKYSAGETIIRENEEGDKIYLIIEGELEAFKQLENGEQTKVYEYKSGDYFGELALLNNTPRQATVQALTDVVLLSCDYHSFRRLMGPLEKILRRNEVKYAQYLK